MPTMRDIKTSINEMVGDMSKDSATAIAELREIVDYASNLLEVLAPEEVDDDDWGGNEGYFEDLGNAVEHE